MTASEWRTLRATLTGVGAALVRIGGAVKAIPREVN